MSREDPVRLVHDITLVPALDAPLRVWTEDIVAVWIRNKNTVCLKLADIMFHSTPAKNDIQPMISWKASEIYI